MRSEKVRSRAEILAEIASLPPSVQGTISSYANVRKNGTKAVYHILQYRGWWSPFFSLVEPQVFPFLFADPLDFTISLHVVHCVRHDATAAENSGKPGLCRPDRAVGRTNCAA